MLFQQGDIAAIIAAIFVVLGWLSWKKRAATVTYMLFLVSTASEAQAFASEDEYQVQALREAIEDAMSRSS